MTTQIGNPFPMFYDLRGRPLDRGSIFIGQIGEDPEVSPLAVFANLDLTDEIAQPIRTIGGLLSRDGAIVFAFVGQSNFSIKVKDADGATVFYAASANPSAATFQPMNNGLSLISKLETADFGRGLLEASDATEARDYLGVPDALPLEGGTVTGPIRRSGGGGHAYAADSTIDNIRLFFTENGAADPRTQVGDIWFEEVA